MKKQIELLKKYGVTNYSVSEDGKITINGYLYLSSLQSCDKDFLKGTTINGGLCLGSLQSCDKDFLKGTTINGYLYLSSLQSCDKDFLNKNVKQLKIGYNKEGNYCFFDGILSKVKSVSEKKGYVIYLTPFGFISQKGSFTAHGITVKKSIQDLEFKIISEKLKKEPITKETKFTVQYYRLLTGACDQGVRSWMQQNDIPFEVVEKETKEKKSILAIDLIPILEKTNAFGYEKIKSLMTF